MCRLKKKIRASISVRLMYGREFHVFICSNSVGHKITGSQSSDTQVTAERFVLKALQFYNWNLNRNK